MKRNLLILCTTAGFAQASTLETAFKNPPPEARPRTWYHVMSGNLSQGLTKDLEAMAETGIGGLLMFNVTAGIRTETVGSIRLSIHA